MAWNYTNEPPWKAVQIKGFWHVTTDRGDPSEEYDVDSSGDEEVARLQAAAPALLAACEGMLHHIDDVLDDEDLTQRRAALIAAIKAAKGGTHVVP